MRYGERPRVSSRVSEWLNGPDAKTGQDLIIAFASDFLQTIPAGTNNAITLTADAAAHTYGAWIQVVASAHYDAAAIYLVDSLFGASTIATGTIMQIGVGAAGAESPIVTVAVGSHSVYPFIVPVKVAAGQRVAARIQSVVTGGKTGIISFGLVPQIGDFASAPTVDTYGVDTATSRGVNLAANNAWTEIVATTTQPYRGAVVVPSASNAGMLSLNNIVAGLGIGASGSETLLGSFRFRTTNTETINQESYGLPFVYVGHIPVGSRLSVRQNQNTTTIDACILGVPYL